jgi:hypothetical protein
MSSGAQLIVPQFDTGTERLFVGDGNDYYDLLNPQECQDVRDYLLDSSLFPAIDVQNRIASTAIPTTANTVLVLPTKVVETDGLLYDTSTGVITFTRAGIYQHILMLNVVSTANRTIYAAAELWDGSQWVKSRYSARQMSVTSNTDGQVVFQSNNKWAAGSQIRFTLWASGACTTQSVDLPGTTAGTQTVPAIRLLYSGNVG